MNNPVKKIRVAIVISHPIQHFVHLYKALANQESIQLKVFFASKIGLNSYFDKDMAVEIKWATDLLGGYEYEFLSEAETIKESGFLKINNPSVTSALKSFAPHVVQLHGYAQLTLLRALLWCNLKRVPVLLWSDSSLLFRRPALKQFLKDMVLPVLLNRFSGVLATGENNAAYYLKYGIKPNAIFRCPFTVDESRLNEAKVNKLKLREQYRTNYKISNHEVVLLFVGKLAPWKRPQDLLLAVRAAQEKLGMTAKLVAFFAGNGVMKAELEAIASTKGIRAVFAGFINVDVLPSIYAMADILIFPSEKEPYGLSAREAVCVGMPLIVSDQIGCIGATDAARPDFNALVYPSLDASSLATKIVALASRPELFTKMSQASLVVASDMAECKSVAGFLSAVNSVVKH
ncbi:glycosyltransferase family 4 protein [Methylotenera sp.]|uniref:glycosyltransferase family 4 protein n=1 Tax=Methylotenera sp. TaxID=2051956 RepID=UPI00248873AB|nr:glycosyltransferase family 4 protein [Methylotenera sp.]MDI1299021.1 glycosyltransferase family 4 protein [Methylotenera sp.]